MDGPGVVKELWRVAALVSAKADFDDLRRLVIPMLAIWDPRAGNDGAAKPQVASARDLFAGERVCLKPVAEALVDQHLLTTSETAGDTSYEVAHEALLRAPPLGQFIAEVQDKYIQAQMLEAEAAEWDRFGRKSDRLARRSGRLTDAQALLRDEGFGVTLRGPTKPVGPYLEACTEADRSERERDNRQRNAELEAARKLGRRTMVGMIAALLLATVAGWQWWDAGEQKRIAKQEASSARFAEYTAQNEATKAKEAEKRATAQRDLATAAERKAEARKAETERLRRSTEFTESGLLSKAADSLLEAGSEIANQTAMLIALEALPDRTSDDESRRTRNWAPITRFQLDRALRRLEAPIVLKGHSTIKSASYSSDGTNILTVSDNAAMVWRVASDGSWVEATTLQDKKWDKVSSATWSADGTKIVTAQSWPDGTAHVWEKGSDGRWRQTIRIKDVPPARAVSASLSPDEMRIVIIKDDGTAKSWTGELGGSWREFALIKGRSSVTRIAWSPDGAHFITIFSQATDIGLWEATTGTQVALLEGHQNAVWDVAWSPDGTRIVTASADETARIWEVNSNGMWTEAALIGDKRFGFGGVTSAKWSPDGKSIVLTVWAKGAFDWTVESDGSWRASTQLKSKTNRPILRAAWSPDGRHIVTTSYHHTAQGWDAETGLQTAVIEGHQGNVLRASFSPDGRSILTASADGTARVWNFRGDIYELVSAAKARATRCLTRNERKKTSYP